MEAVAKPQKLLMTPEEQREEKNRKQREYYRKRCSENPAYVQERSKYQRERLASDADYLAYTKNRKREWRQQKSVDPAFRACVAQQAARYRRQRMAVDPDYCVRIKAYNKAKWAKMTQEQKDEYKRRFRERYQSDPEFRERCQNRNQQRLIENPEVRAEYKRRRKERLASDPEYREEVLARNRRRYMNDPEYRNRCIERMRWLRENDPQYLEKRKQYRIASGNEKRRERYAADPVHRESVREYRRQWMRDRGRSDRRDRFFSDFQVLKEKLQAYVDRPENCSEV